MSKNHTATEIEQAWVAPPPATTAEQSLTLNLFDIVWLYFAPIERLIFYESPLSRTRFIETIIPKLKNSLELTLEHFFPLAGNLVVPTNTSTPEIRYLVGDSVSLVFAESNGDLENFTANHPRIAHEFYPLVPRLPEAKKTEESLKAPVLALKVTLFPDQGLCVGITNHHVVGDARSIFNFMKRWAFIAKLGEAANLPTNESYPVYDSNLIKDPNGIREIHLGQVEKMMQEKAFTTPAQEEQIKVRATFIMSRSQTQRLKTLVSTQRPELKYVSTFTVVCAYIWVCKVRSGAGSDQSVNQDDVHHFACVADCRGRLDPPLPTTYFGNCLALCMVSEKTTRLMGKEGFVTAAGLIGESIRNRMHSEEGVLKGAEDWLSELNSMNWGRLTGVAGSPKFNYYDLDFGWGNGKKFEFVSIDGTGALSLNACRESRPQGEGGIEVGLSLPRSQMDSFTAIFLDGLK